MRAIALAVIASGCTGDHAGLRIEPPEVDLVVALDGTARVPLVVTADDSDVTGDVELVLEGTDLGTVGPTGFASNGRTGGRAKIVARYAGATAEIPVHVRVESRRFIQVPSDAVGWFSRFEVPYEAGLEPGDGAVLPPNLGTLDVHFDAVATDDTHELAITTPDLDLRVFSATTRRIELTRSEWDSLSRTARGTTAELTVKSLVAAGGDVRVSRAQIAIAELLLASEVLFTGRATGDEMPQMWSYDLFRATTEAWTALPAGNCVGCHVAISRDGARIAAGGSVGTAGGGVILNAITKDFTAPPSAAVGNWTSATFDPSGLLVTTNSGTLTVRDGTTAMPLASVTPELPAAQPAIAHHRQTLAYVGGPIDLASTQPVQQELRIHEWDPATATLGRPGILVPKREGEFLKLPEFSPDDRWVMFSRVPAQFRSTGKIVVARTDGGEQLELANDADFARFASPLATARSGGEAEPMLWIVMKSYRAVGTRTQTGVGQLWAMAFYPERGVASRPIHLPGQRADVAVLHAPLVLYRE